MCETILTRHDDNVGEGSFDSIAWALDVYAHMPDTHAYHFAILYGNEDAPEMIDFYTQADPLITDHRAIRWVSAHAYQEGR